MTVQSSDDFGANLLRSSARALAGYAAGNLLESVPAADQAYSSDPFSMWRNWLAGRTEELAAALAVGKPDLFVAQVQWSRAVLEARGVAADHFRAAMECLQQVLNQELPDGPHERAREYVSLALQRFDGEAQEKTGGLSVDTPTGRLAAEYLLAILEGDRRRARELVLGERAEGLPIPRRYLEIVLPAQMEIGRMWLANEITVAEEHFATATTRTVLAQLLAQAPVRASNGKTVLTAAVAGNRHDIGLLAVCDFFEMDGWRAIQLGADVPIGDLVEAVGTFRVDLLALSATQSTHLPTLQDTIEAVRSRCDSETPKILVGGLAFQTCPDAAHQLGADAYASDPLEAVRVGNSLFGLSSEPLC